MSNDVSLNDQHSTLLTALPAEIRNNIYERVLIHRRPIKIVRGRSERKTRVLLDVCRQLKAEFSGLYYHANAFTSQCSESDLDRDLDSTNSLIQWLQRIGARNRGMLREVQVRIVSSRALTKDDLFPFLRDQNVRLARQVGWLPLSIMRVRLESQWLSQAELSELIVEEEKEEEIDALERTGSSPPKGPELLLWERDVHDPVLDQYSKPGKRPLSEFVCPATWRYHARKYEASISDEQSWEVPVEKEAEIGCLSGGLKVLAAKIQPLYSNIILQHHTPTSHSNISVFPDKADSDKRSSDRSPAAPKQGVSAMDKSPLATLPAELRNEIYKAALVDTCELGIVVDRSSDCDFNMGWIAPALLQVCRQIRDEGTPIYYGLNTFSIASSASKIPRMDPREVAPFGFRRHELSGIEYHSQLASWAILLGRRTSSCLRTVYLWDMAFIEEVDSRLAACKAHLQSRRVELPAAKIMMEVISEDKGWESDIWLTSASDDVLNSLPRDKRRRDEILQGGEAARLWWHRNGRN